MNRWPVALAYLKGKDTESDEAQEQRNSKQSRPICLVPAPCPTSRFFLQERAVNHRKAKLVALGVRETPARREYAPVSCVMAESCARISQ